MKRAFDIKKTNQIEELKKEIALQEKNIITFEAEISDLEKQLSELKEPTLEEYLNRVNNFGDSSRSHNRISKSMIVERKR